MRLSYCLIMLAAAVWDVQMLRADGHAVLAVGFTLVVIVLLVLLASELQQLGPSLADRVIQRALRTPYRHLAGYMNRYWFLRLGHRPGSVHPLIAARVHHILRSDAGEDFHDHPWPYLTIILRGGYCEVRPVLDASGRVIEERRRWYGPGSVLLRRAGTWHRLELQPGRTAWTLFCTGPKVQGWGFLSRGAKVPYWRYLGLPADSAGED